MKLRGVFLPCLLCSLGSQSAHRPLRFFLILDAFGKPPVLRVCPLVSVFGVEAPGADDLVNYCTVSGPPAVCSSLIPTLLVQFLSALIALSGLWSFVLSCAIPSPGSLSLRVWLLFLPASTAWCSAHAVAALLLFSDISILSLQPPLKGHGYCGST